LDHILGLGERNYFVLQALEDNHRAIQSVGKVNGRTGDVEIAVLGVGADQAVEVARFELVRVSGERFEIADAVVAGAGFENVAERERAQRRVAAGAATTDRQTITVDFAAFGKVARAVDAVVDVDDAPLAVEPLPTRGRTRAPLIYIENGDAPTGPVLGRIF
jgi:hypothetical protein